MEARMRRLLGLVLFFSVVVGGATPAVAEVGPLSRITGPSPFAPGCGGGAAGGTNYRNAEVEPWVTSNPADPSNLVAVWQQDRWSNGGSQGNLTGVSFNRGRTWDRPTPPLFPSAREARLPTGATTLVPPIPG